MSQHATPQNVQDLARITAEAVSALLDATAALSSLSFRITDQPLFDATFSDLAGRLDDISRLVDQYDNLRRSLEKAITAPPPTP